MLRRLSCVALLPLLLSAGTGCGSTPARTSCDPAGCPAGQTCVADQCAADPLATCPTGYVRLEAGTFTMGSPTNEPRRAADETQHQVTLSRPFCLKATEVTRDEFQGLMGYDPSKQTPCTGGGACPVSQVRWMEAAAYCNALSRKDGVAQCYDCTGSIEKLDLVCPRKAGWISCQGYRLPSEAEWEYGARAGTSTAFPSGDFVVAGFCESSTLQAVGWFCGNSNREAHPVAKKVANAWGLYDMAGNLTEWTNDAFTAYPTGPVTDPDAGPSGLGVVTRGGAYDLDADRCRSAAREGATPGMGEGNQGFRPMRYLK